MSFAIYFKPKSMNAKQYDEITGRLEKAGLEHPKGRIYHACFGEKNNLQVLDIWESKEDFNSRFGETLMPILKKVGVDPGQPEIHEVHNKILGEYNLILARSMYDNFNARKFEEASENVSENVIIHNVPLNVQLHGKEGFLQFMNFWAAAFPDSKVEITSQTASGDRVITEFHGRGTHNGVLETPMGKFGPTGKKIDIPFCEIFTIKNGKVENSHLYFDVATIMNQLELTLEKV
ncbi:MAG TPA: ester cyclase [Ignavibacteriaceae bacterium]|nr:ester cyclase [Ignavibacteriaceae bacterium]